MNVIIVNATKETALNWIGDNSLLERLTDELVKCRSANAIVVAYQGRAQIYELTGVMAWKDFEVTNTVALHEAMEPFKLMRWVKSRKKFPQGSNYIYCDPHYPFLGVNKIESIIYSITEGKVESVTTVNEGFALNGSEQMAVVKRMDRWVPACIALQDEVIDGEDEEASPEEFLGKCTKVVLTQLEALEVSSREGQLLAEGYINQA
jgi:hypothetical protein